MPCAPIIIAGAGPAGLTLARQLARRSIAVNVIDGYAAGGAARPERGLGLWPRSQVVLRQLGLDHLLDSALRIPAAAYRSRDGAWLSASADGELNRRRVCTVLESELLAALKDGLPNDSLRRGSTVVAATPRPDGAGGVAVTLSDGSCIDGSALVGADGVCSTVRRLAFRSSMTEAVHTGFVASSGVLLGAAGGAAAAAEEDDDAEGCDTRALARSALLGSRRCAFETLHAGRRFALVPLANGDAFWFATRPREEAMMAAVAEDGSSSEAARSAAAMSALRDHYDGWHAPIPNVLHYAACASVEAAMASAGVRVTTGFPDSGASTRTSCGGDDGSGGETTIRSGAPRFEELYAAPPLARWWSAGGGDPRVVLVGDAAHGLPINLAQGASAAIEGAFLLGEAVSPILEDSRGSSGDEDEDGAYARAFAQYQAAHEPRVRQCSVLTSFTALLAAPASPPTEALRNAMRFVPQPLNSQIFDAALDLSLGELPGSTRKHWPLATAPTE